jgi:hypothetical protein
LVFIFLAQPTSYLFMFFSAPSHRGRLRLVDSSPTGRRVGFRPYGPEAAISAVNKKRNNLTAEFAKIAEKDIL